MFAAGLCANHICRVLSQSLANGGLGQSLENSTKIKYFDWLPHNGLNCFPAVIKFQFPRVSPGDHPLTKKPEDSGYKIFWVL